MSAPVINTAGDSTPGRLLHVDLNMTYPLNTGAPVWTPVQYVESTNFQPDNPNMADATVYGDAGYGGQDKLGATWSLALTLNHMIVPGSNPPAYDATHDFLQTHGVGAFGAANRVQLRIYDFDENDLTGVVTPRGQAYMGFANYSWPGFGDTGQADPRKVALTFEGKGKLNPITHPYPVTPTAPTVSSVTPATAGTAGGTLVRIRGGQFTGATAVTVGGTAVTNFTVVDSGLIIATVPAKAAGAYAVVVTNGVGPSSSTPTSNNTITYS